MQFSMSYLHGSHLGPEPPKYNPHCGHKMRVVYYVDGYDSDTGEKILKKRAQCDTWFRFGCWHADQDCMGDWPWVGQ